MVTEMFVRNGKYTNFPKNARKNEKGFIEQETYLDMIDAKGWEDNSHTAKDSKIAKQKALKKARQYEKEGWKLVTIVGKYSYGNENPYRYEVLSWGGFK